MINARTITSFILSAVRPFRWLLSVHVLITLLWAIDLSLRPYLLKMIIDRIPNIAPHQAYEALILPIGLYIGASIFMSAMYRVYDFVILEISSPMRRHIGLQLMDQMMEHSAQFYGTHFAGSLGNRIRDVMSGVVMLVRLVIDQFLSQLLAITFAVVTLWSVNIRFALALCAWSFVYVIASAKLAGKARVYSERAAQAYSGVVGTVVDILGNMAAVRLFNGRLTELKNMKTSLDHYVVGEKRRGYYFLKMFIFQGVLFLSYQIVSIMWLVQGFARGVISPGDFVLIIMINMAIIESLWSLSRDMGNVAEHVGNISQGLKIVLAPRQIVNNEHAKKLVVTRGEILFDNISFHYKNSQLLFKDKTLRIPPGQRVGLVGYSGSGKSSLVNIMLRLYEVSSGRIVIDGQGITQVTQESLRSSTGVITQDPYLFHRSILENIRYGKHDATDQEVIEAAKRAHAHNFIMDLSHGYDTQAGERGVLLSGGQRQRISIARAILKNAPILVLDEATSQLDSITEGEIQDSLNMLMAGKTTLVIAHRLSTLLHMDRILVFDKGVIVQDGSHLELLDSEGLYRSLWYAQTGGLLPEAKQA